jgi:hypothetical protein
MSQLLKTVGKRLRISLFIYPKSPLSHSFSDVLAGVPHDP